MPDDGLELEGKAVLVRSEGTPHLTLLTDVHFATEQGRRFLVGTVAEGMSESDWSKGIASPSRGTRCRR